MRVLEDFEKVIDNGLPKGSILLLRGVPSSGKTIFCLTLVKELLENGTRCIYVTTELPPDALKKQAYSEFGWDLAKDEREGRLLFLDGYSWRLGKTGPHVLDLSSLTQVGHSLFELFRKESGRFFFVFDSLTSLMLYNKPANVTQFMQVQVARLREKNAGGVLVLEAGVSDQQTINLLSFFVDGLFELAVREEQGTLHGYFRVFAVRNASHRKSWMPFAICGKGFAFSRLS